MASFALSLTSRQIPCARLRPHTGLYISAPILGTSVNKVSRLQPTKNQIVKYSVVCYSADSHFRNLNSNLYYINLQCATKFKSQSLINSKPYKVLHTDAAEAQKNAVSKHVRKDNFSEKAKEATKTTYYGIVILAGLGVAGALAYTIFKELFASFSPQSVYSDAVTKCTSHPRVQDMMGGESLKCYGEENRRGRRQHVSHVTYEVAGQRGMRIRFYIKGDRRTGTANLDARDSSSGWYYRYLYVELDQYPYDVIVVVDNRGIDDDGTDYSVGPVSLHQA